MPTDQPATAARATGAIVPPKGAEAASHPSALIGWNVDLTVPCGHLGNVVMVRNPLTEEAESA